MVLHINNLCYCFVFGKQYIPLSVISESRGRTRMMETRVSRQMQGRYARYSTVVPKALVLMYDLKDKYLEWMFSGPDLIHVIIQDHSISDRNLSKIF